MQKVTIYYLENQKSTPEFLWKKSLLPKYVQKRRMCLEKQKKIMPGEARERGGNNSTENLITWKNMRIQKGAFSVGAKHH